MNWTDVLGGALGGLVGSAIPGWIAWVGLHRERMRLLADRWSGKDAPVIAEVIRLLQDADPARRMASISADRDAEQVVWEGIQARRAKASAQLLDMHVGHPSNEVRVCARELDGQLAASVVQTLWVVKDQVSNQQIPGQYDVSVQSHEMATATAERLRGLVIAHGSGN